jgi:hypothetical protein
MTLYCDTNVKFGGANVGGIRISHVSHIDGPREIGLTASKGKSQVWTVQPLKTERATESVEDRIGKVIAAIQRAKDKSQLDKVMELAQGLYATLQLSLVKK